MSPDNFNPDDIARQILEKRIAQVHALFDPENGSAVLGICHGCGERKSALLCTRTDQHGKHVEADSIMQLLCEPCGFGEDYNLVCIPVIRMARVAITHSN